MNDDTIVGAPAEPSTADPLLLLQPTPAAPSSPAGATTTISLTVPSEAVAAVSKVVEQVGASLFPAPRAPAPAKSSPAAQALTAGILQGLGRKYQDKAMSAAGQWLEQRLGAMPAVAKSTKPSGKPLRKGKSRNKGKRRGR